jgi:nitrogen-specific signal transduction histidine kinase
MSDNQPNQRFNGWNLKLVVGGAAAVLVTFLTALAINFVSTIIDDHDKLVTVLLRMENLERQVAGERITGRMQSIDTRLTVAERELARHSAYLERSRR